MSRDPQADLFRAPNEKRPPLAHGGSGTRGRRKVLRPLATNKPVHLTLRATAAKGEMNFLRAHNRLEIAALLKRQAARFHVRVESWVNVGNHLHLKIRFRTRRGFQNFLRTFTAVLARKITGACRGKPFGKFWDALAFTRVLASKREVANLDRYFDANAAEAFAGPAAREEVLARKFPWEKRRKLTG